jgi:Raf kinase inhibitor-like YbhB/YbcL family protein
MQIRSSAFADGSSIPRRFTCEGENVSPPLAWSDAPSQTRSFVLLCDDPDAPAGTWHHWAAYDIPPGVTEFAEGGAQRGGRHWKEAVNDFRRSGYGGPCPPPGHGPHHYQFRLLALSVDHLRLGDKASCRDVEREARKHPLEEATLVGIYQR